MRCALNRPDVAGAIFVGGEVELVSIGREKGLGAPIARQQEGRHSLGRPYVVYALRIVHLNTGKVEISRHREEALVTIGGEGDAGFHAVGQGKDSGGEYRWRRARRSLAEVWPRRRLGGRRENGSGQQHSGQTH